MQIRVNNFKIGSGFISAVPGVVYSLFAGALSDRHGRKFLIYLPVFGTVLAYVSQMINYAYIR